MDRRKRIKKIQERLERQEVSRLLPMSFEEVVEQLAGLRPAILSSYLRALSTEALLEFAGRTWRMLCSWDLGISEEEISDEQYEAWNRAEGYRQGEVSGAMGPSFETD